MNMKKTEIADVLHVTIKTVYNKFKCTNGDFTLGDIADLAVHYQVSPETILQWIQQDRIEGVKQNDKDGD